MSHGPQAAQVAFQEVAITQGAASHVHRVGPVLGWDYQHVYPLGGDRYLWLFQDTFIDLTNDLGADLQINMYFVNGDPPAAADELGPGFRLTDSCLEVHTTPGGALQQFLYARFHRVG